MMKAYRSQNGSAHVIILIILVIALFAALGVVFYQNFIVKKDTYTSAPVVNTPASTTRTTRVAYQSTIYALDYPKDWTAKSDSSTSDTVTTFVNPSQTVRVKISIGSGSVSGSCDINDGQKISHYNVVQTPNIKLTGQALNVVEAIYDAPKGGYLYTIGLTQDGGATHAALGDSHCNVAPVGLASNVLLNNNVVVHPTIIAMIEFPKLTKDGAPVSEMQPIKDLMSSDDYNTAVKILESARKE